MSALLGRVYAERSHARGRREATARWLSTVGYLATLALGVLVVPLTAEAQAPGKVSWREPLE